MKPISSQSNTSTRDHHDLQQLQNLQTHQILEQMRYKIVPGKLLPSLDSTLYLETFNCWHEVWQEAFNELHPNQKMFSDAFTRQDYIGALFFNNECIALSFFNIVDLAHPPGQMDSYFECWPEAALCGLTAYSKQVIVCSYFTVRKNWRKSVQQLSISKISMGLHLEFFLNQELPTMTGAMRCDRGAHLLAYSFGATPLMQNVVSPHNDYMDLVAFHKKSIHSGRELIGDCVQQIWQQSELSNNNFTWRKSA